MKSVLMRLIAAVTLVTALAAGCASTPGATKGKPAPETESLSVFILRQMDTGHIPGLAACIVKNGETRWAEGFGFANEEGKTPASADTLFQLGSVAKAVTAAAVMQLCERGLCDLDADVNTYLPFPLNNPAQPNTPITLRALLAHTSSIRDNPDLYTSLYTISSGGGDSPIGLDQFLRDYLVPGGDWYDAQASFYPVEPGTQFGHSNVGYAVAGYIVERLSGMPFDQYCREHIFGPLGMQHSHWFLRDADAAQVAMPYRFDVQAQAYVPYGLYGFPTYPDGQLRCSARDFARFLAAFINGGVLDGARILDRASVDEMVTIQYPEANPDLGLGWWYGAIANQEAIGLDGRDPGVCTSAFYLRDSNVGVILFTNTDCTAIGDQARHAIQERLLAEAAKL